jgi:hypothetical protein
MVLKRKLASVCELFNYCRFHEARVQGNSSNGALQITEPFQVYRWMTKQAVLTHIVVEKICEGQAVCGFPQW